MRFCPASQRSLPDSATKDAKDFIPRPTRKNH